LFAKEQPDLNWENEETRKAIYDSAMRFWLEKGVDGFRVDVVNMSVTPRPSVSQPRNDTNINARYSKGVEFKDAPIIDARFYEQPAWLYYANGPRMHEFLREMNQAVLDKYNAVTVGELPHTPDTKKVLDYVSAHNKQLSMVFQFDIVDLGQGREHKYHFEEWKLSQLKAIVAKWQQFIEGTDGWTTVFCENHGGCTPPPLFPHPTPNTHPNQTKAAPSRATPPTPPRSAPPRPSSSRSCSAR